MGSDFHFVDRLAGLFALGVKAGGKGVKNLMQLAAYAKGLGMEKYRAANIFVSTSNPGLVRIVEYSMEDMRTHWEMFFHLLMFWQKRNKHEG